MTKVQSIERAFRILQALANQQTGLGVNELSRRVDLPNSTVSRILQTLEELRAVAKVNGTHRFTIGESLIQMVLRVPYGSMLQAVARPYLQELADRTEETVNLCISEGWSVVHLDQVNSRHLVQVRTWVGRRVPWHCDSSGKIFLAYQTEDQVDEYLAHPLEKPTPNTIIDPEELRAELCRIRERGHAWGLEELEEGLIGVSAPIFSTDGHVLATINVCGPDYRMHPAKRDELPQLIKAATNRVSKLLHNHNNEIYLDNGDGSHL
jgi:IclR family KDG regulon transcriptional repressor